MGVKVKINRAGARAVRNSSEVQAVLKQTADRIAGNANAMLGDVRSEGYEAYVQPGRNRARAVVHTTDRASQRHNRKTNAILKGL